MNTQIDDFISDVVPVPEEPKPKIDEDKVYAAWLEILMQQSLSRLTSFK